MKKNIKKGIITTLFAFGLCVSSAGLVACGEKEEGIKYTFETNGGAKIEVMDAEAGASITLPIPEKAGYEFEGWYTNAEFTGEPVTTVVAESSATYYAKWAQLYTITLDLKGGSLSSTSISLKAGANIYKAVADLVPQKDLAQFGAWLYNGAELAKNATMPESNITLTAKYKVAYTAEIWVQNTATGEYEKDQEIVSYEYAGVEVTSSQKLVGLKEVKHDNTLVKLVLSENAAENIFKHYYTRETFEVRFEPNAPDGSALQATTEEVVYGESVEVPSNYTVEGYCLIGWATSKTGEMVYKANYIESMLFNAEGELQPADEVSPERDITLYGVWAKGYEDMFGNDDYIYLLSSDATVAYLSRGGIFFQGTYKADLGEFIFLVNGKIKKGRLFESTFAYSDADRAAKTFQLYEVGVGLIEDGATISFNEYNGLTYYAINPETGLKEPSTGTYVIEEDIYFVATFTEGMMAGKTITFIVGTVSEERKPAFQLRNDEEAALGQLYMFYVDEEGKMQHKEDAGMLVLNGFGKATFYTDKEKYTTFSYTYENNVIKLTDTNGQSAGEAYVVEIDGIKGYLVKDETYAHTYEMDGGESVTLDGLATATQTNAKGEVLFEGYYTVKESAFGGYVAWVVAENGESKKFLLSEKTVEIPSEEEGKTETQTQYSAAEKLSSYYEYYYKDENATYYAPLITINDPEEGKAIMYGYTNAKTYEKVADCTYDYDATTGLYVFNVTPVAYSENVFTETVDYATLKSFVCALDKDSTSYSVSYWYTVETESGETDYRKYYTSANGGELMLVGGFAFYTVNGTTISGPYSLDGTMMGITTKSGEEVYLEMDEENKTFIVLSAEPYKSYAYVNGETDQKQFLTFDGKGGVTYTITATEEGAENTVYEGTTEKLAETTFTGAPIYLFKSGDFSFKYIALATSTQQFFAAYNETRNGKYESDDGILEIDGFGFNAKFTAADGNVYDGRYTIDEENAVINFLYEEETWFFDMDFEGREFTLRGEEANTNYLLVDNQLFQGLLLEMDGYGKLTVYKLEAQEGEEKSQRVDVDVNGTYEINGDVYTLRYKNGAEEVTLEGEIGTFTSGNYIYAAFLVSHKEVVQVYVNAEDWSVLILDDIGNAIKYDGNGMKDTGRYTIVTDNMLYFVNDSSTDACIYNYNKATGEAVQSSFTAVGYFTKDLESLLFSQYGFAIFNGADYYYYEIVNSDYLIYRQDPTNEAANEYGFVQENFGPLVSEKDYNGKYYYQNTGYAITFGREETTKEDYPVYIGENLKKPLEDIIFTPSGDGEFEVTCLVKLNGYNLTGTAVREIDENGNVETYILLAANMGYYRFDIELTYTGLDKQEAEEGDTRAYNSYKVVGMRWIRSIYSYQYLQTYYLYYMFYGAEKAYSYQNNIGMLYLNQEFMADGESGDIYVETKFFEGSNTYDTLGEIISIDKGSYEPYKDWANYYRSTFVGADGYTYHFYFMIQQHMKFRDTYGYRVYAFTREETLTTEDGYEVVIEKVIASESSVKTGGIFDVQLSKDGEEIEKDAIMYKDNSVYYIVREKSEDGVITATKYYKLLLTEEGSDLSGSIGGETEEETKVIPLYIKVEVKEQIVETLYTEDGASFVDIHEEEGITVYSANGTQNAIVESVYDEGTASYTITLASGKKYVVEVIEVEGNEKVTITEVVETEDESEESEEA